MKKYMLITLLCFLSNFSGAHTWTGENNVWTYCHVGYNSWNENNPICELSFTKYYFDGEQILDGKNYKVLCCQEIRYNNTHSSSPDTWRLTNGMVTNEPVSFIGVREDNGRIYVNAEEYCKQTGMDEKMIKVLQDNGIIKPFENEYILYDFNETLPTGVIPYIGHINDLFFRFMEKPTDGVIRKDFLNLFFRSGEKEYQSPDYISDPFFPLETAYRPFIEENKVWHVGYFPGASSIATRGNTYYFDGDTIVGGETCKRWMCNGNLIAPIYERDGQVWLFPKGEETPQLIYNFNVQEGDDFSTYWIDNKKTGTCTVKSVREAYSSDYPLRTINIYDSFTLEQLAQAGYDKEKDPEEYDAVLNLSCIEWIEGVGSCVRLEDNIGIGGWVGYYYSLVDVKVGDEIIYKNPSLTWDYDAIHAPQSSIINHGSSNHHYHDLSGRRLSTPPTRRGVYVNGGRKVLIK